MSTSSVECRSCRSNSGERRISPGAPVHVGEHWQVEHAYPTSLAGWLVVVLRRHCEALHELRPPEFAELGPVLEATCRALREVVGCEKEYVACYAEIEGFRHVHFHVVPVAADTPQELRGGKSFAHLKVPEHEAVPRAQVAALCEHLAQAFRSFHRARPQPPEILLRPASEQDRRFAYEVKRAALGPYVTQVWGWDEDFQQEFHARDWAVRRPEIVVHDGVDIGTVQFVRGEADYHVGELYLLPGYQRRGIGSRILRRLTSIADAEAVPVRLEVIKINPARSLYERHGFEICGETETHYLMRRDPAPESFRQA